MNKNKDEEINYCERVIRPLLTNYTIPHGWGYVTENKEIDLGIWKNIFFEYSYDTRKYTIDETILGKLRHSRYSPIAG
jgi:hypothetical protein